MLQPTSNPLLHPLLLPRVPYSTFLLKGLQAMFSHQSPQDTSTDLGFSPDGRLIPRSTLTSAFISLVSARSSNVSCNPSLWQSPMNAHKRALPCTDGPAIARQCLHKESCMRILFQLLAEAFFRHRLRLRLKSSTMVLYTYSSFPVQCSRYFLLSPLQKLDCQHAGVQRTNRPSSLLPITSSACSSPGG